MKIKAAIVREKSGKFLIEEIDLDNPRDQFCASGVPHSLHALEKRARHVLPQTLLRKGSIPPLFVDERLVRHPGVDLRPRSSA